MLLINKNASNHSGTNAFEFLCTIFFSVEKNISSHLIFDKMSETFIPDKISAEESCRSYGPLPILGHLTAYTEHFLGLLLRSFTFP